MSSGLNNIYATLPAFAADPPETENKPPIPPAQDEDVNPYTSKFRAKALRRIAARRAKAQAKQEEELFFENAITWAEDGHTAIAKLDTDKPHRQNIERGHKTSTTTMPSILQTSKNWGYALQSTIKGWARNVSQDKTHVRFAKKAQIQEFNKSDEPIMASLDSGADNHYISEEDRKKLGLPILKKSSRRVGVANGGTSKGVNVTQLPFEKLSAKAVKADTFNDFPDSLISVGQLADDETGSIFSKEGVSVHKEEDVLITVKNEPLLIGVRDEQGRYRIPLQQHKGQWKPRHASKKARQTLRKANSVYDLPSTEQAIKWIHAVCGYPVKTTWLKAIKAGNYVGWPLLTVKNVTKYYPETTETPKGHLNQTRKNVRSTKPKPFKTVNTSQLVGKKVQDIHTSVRSPRNSVYRSNRSVPNAVKVRQQIHHGHGRHRQQRDLSRTLKKSQGCRITQSIHKFDDKAQSSWHIPQETCSRQ
eukprot:scaffold36896_cov36-Cyclotella_meneghiniana.AAC.1